MFLCFPLLLFSRRSELQTLPNELWFNALQYVSPEDALLLHGSHPLVRSIAIAVFSYTLIDKEVHPIDVTGATPAVHLPFLSYVREDDDFSSLARRLAAHTGEKETWHELTLATVDSHVPSYLPRTAPAGSTPATSPQVSGRKSSVVDSQADSQATEIDPDMTSEPIQPPVVPPLEPESPSYYNVAKAALSAVHHAFVGPPSVPPPQSSSPGASATNTSTTATNGAVPSAVPTALWRYFHSRYGRMPTRHQLAQRVPVGKGAFVRLGIQRAVISSTSPRVG